MGHRPGQHTYEMYYLPEALPRDFQAIYFGTVARDHLVQQICQIGISRNDRAPIALNEAQKAQFKV